MNTKTTTQNVCTVSLSNEVTAIVFKENYAFYHIRNDGTATVYTSLDSTIEAGADGVYSIPSGETVTVANTYPNKSLYIASGTGNILISADNSKNNPFRVSGSGGGGNTSDVTEKDIYDICRVCADGVTSLGDLSSSSTAWAMSEAYIPDSVLSIGTYRFYKSQYLFKILGANNVNSVGTAFCSGCANLITIDLPNLSAINGTAFCSNCTSLITIELPNLSNTNSTFCTNCTSLTNLSFGGRENVLTLSISTSNWATSIKSTTLTVDSLVALGTALKTWTNATYTATWTFAKTAWDRLSEDEQGIFIAKGYIVSAPTD